MLSRAAVLVAALSLLTPGIGRTASADQPKKEKAKKPALEIRPTPRFAFSPANIFFTAELKGGDDVEELYCPEVEWEWGDGGRSVEESDCDPWATGAKIERRFTGNHVYPQAGIFPVRVTLRKSGRTIMTQTMNITVRAGLGDPSPDPGE